MCNPSEWLERIIGTCFVVSVLGALISTDTLRAETLPSAESVLDEALQLVVPLKKPGDESGLVEIAMRQVQVRSCEKAKDLFRTALDWNERWIKEKADKLQVNGQIGFLDGLMGKQRRAGCVEEMKATAQRLGTLYQQRNQKSREASAGDEIATAVHNLQHQLDLGNLYESMGDLDAARGVVPTIIQEVWAAKWQRSGEFHSAVVFLAQIGRDEEAFEVLKQYDHYYETRERSEVDLGIARWWMYRVGNLAEVAAAQARAGHQEAARATLRRAIEKARATPVARLTEVYGATDGYLRGEIKLNALGEGEALQSGGAMRIVWHAARIGETALALEAFELTSPLANASMSTGALITALTRKGEVETAQKLLDRFQCNSRAITRGLLDRQDWAGAIQADEAYQKSSCCKRECDFFEHILDTLTDLGKARTFAQGEARALAWARNQKVYKVYALLGVVDALIEQNQMKK